MQHAAAGAAPDLGAISAFSLPATRLASQPISGAANAERSAALEPLSCRTISMMLSTVVHLAKALPAIVMDLHLIITA
jgi:hypothetical protein